MLRKQLLIALGMVAAVAVCLLAARHAMGRHSAAGMATADRLALAWRWLLVPGLCLLAGIGSTANQRFLRADAIDGGAAKGPGFLEINLRYNTNTLEQTVLAVIAWTGLALNLAPQNLGLIPTLAGLFAAGRVAFWIGYLYAPWARAFGLGLTAYPTFFVLAWLAVRLIA
ncbi:hypothetical protein [Phenylobacterium sp.]|jgi:hypothetical protein|uniref:hypothetical protein n=1 Tax=Phenylobacterium sp. TaxID=1871053 RepID=UPI002E3297C6|nr:hypothetical protein [Phenylobacterium sp.]HEX3365808.1 hypothetical protein [Phenylobacterium sp.]